MPITVAPHSWREAVAWPPLWVRSSRSAASGCARRSTRKCFVARVTSVANSSSPIRLPTNRPQPSAPGTVRAATISAPSSLNAARALLCSPATHHVAPLPARTGVSPHNSPIRSRQPCQLRLDTDRCRLEVVVPVACRTAELVPRHVGGLAADGQGRDHQRHRALEVRERLDLLADAAHARPTTHEAEGDVGADHHGRCRIGDATPAQHGGGVARPATEASAVRDALVDRDVGLAFDEPQRLAHEVAVVDRNPLGIATR